MHFPMDWPQDIDVQTIQQMFTPEETISLTAFSNTPAPSEDIWKKFDFLPTPPRSPSRQPDSFDNFDCCSSEEDILSEDVVFEYLLSDLLDDDFPFDPNSPEICDIIIDDEMIEDWSSEEAPLPPPVEEPVIACSKSALTAGLRNELLHDCMWSGQCTESCQSRSAESTDFADGTSALADPGSVCGKPTVILPTETVIVKTEIQDCVDPSAVLPYTPFNDHSYHSNRSGIVAAPTTTVSTTIPKVTPINYPASDTPSDSDEDDDDDDDDDEDEEIDVVTLPEDFRKRSRPSYQRNNVAVRQKSYSRQRNTKRHSPIRKLKLTAHSSQGKVLTDSGGNGKVSGNHGINFEIQLGARRLKENSVCQNRTKESSGSSNSSSDSENHCGKRSQHNHMERKRRDDLRFAFQNLRQNVPGLRDNPKAPKVLILSKASEYVTQLVQQEKDLRHFRTIELKKREQLALKLKKLQNSAKTSKK